MTAFVHLYYCIISINVLSVVIIFFRRTTKDLFFFGRNMLLYSFNIALDLIDINLFSVKYAR